MEQRERRRARVAVSVCVLLLIPLALLLSRIGPAGGNGVSIHEILASNSVLPDADGNYRDFVELYNGGSRAADLSGCGLTDSDAVKYRFPEGTVLAPGGYLAVWCDSAADGDAAPFSISRQGGETVSLFSARGRLLDAVETVPAPRDHSMVPDGSGGWTLSDAPTPGFPNTPEGRAACLAAMSRTAPAVVISEFMTANSLYPGPEGEYTDWVELHNAGTAPVDLGGWSLSDASDESGYVFVPGTLLPPGAYLAVWCGAEEAGFSLNRGGGEPLTLFGADGTLCSRVETPALEKNCAYALGEAGWETTREATPGFSNDAEGFEAYLDSMGWGGCAVVVSEVMAENRSCIRDGFGAFSDWIELRNDGTEEADLGGFWLSDDPERPDKWQIPSLRIAAGGFALVWCDARDTVSEGECHAGFSLSKSGETVTLSTPVGSPVSELRFGALGADRSAVNTGAEALVTDAPSPGFENGAAGALAFLSSRETPASVAINEVMSSNGYLLRQSDRKCYDWAELRNNGAETVSLGGYMLSDDPAVPDRFVFPETRLRPGEHYVVLLTGESAPRTRYACAPFSLNAEEDWLYLFSPEGELLDHVRVADLPYRGSMGRVPGENGFFYFASPTPGAENAGGERGMTTPPSADAAPGIYNGVEAVTVRLSGQGEIRYTTDGSVPTERSPLYTEPLVLTATTALRARCFAPALLPGDTATLNYIINENHTLPVVCFDLAPADLKYIYQGEYANKEVPANISMFETEGGSFSKDCGLTLHGASSRVYYSKKSMKAVFRPRYDGELAYDVFGDGEITTFDSITLRGGTMSYSYSLTRDAIATEVTMSLGARVLALKCRYCILYINGNYWGIYAIREAYSEKYCADHLGVREEDIQIVRAPVTQGMSADLRGRIDRLQWGGRTSYEEMSQWFDMDSLVDWMLLQAYFSNSDVPGNVRYVYSAADGKWRYALFDLDLGLLNGTVNWNYVFDLSNQCGVIPRAIIRDPVFQEKLLERMSEWLNGPLTDAYVQSVLDGVYDLIEPEWPREAERWGGESYFASSRRAMTGFLSQDRTGSMIRGLADHLHLSEEETERWFGALLN